MSPSPFSRLLLCLLCSDLLCIAVPAQAERRELSPDRPDTTESPYTVERGVFQLELSFLDFVADGDETTWTVLPFNLKTGLSQSVDLQLVFEPYRHRKGGSDGIGDAQVRLKVNLWGNDGGKTAFAIMPFVTFPTSSDAEKIEGGLIFPFAIALAERTGLGLMVETDFVYDPQDDGYDTELVLTAVVGFDAGPRLGLYLEAIAIEPLAGGGGSQQLLGGGLTWALGADVLLDAGVNVGLNRAAEDFNAFTGMTFRF